MSIVDKINEKTGKFANNIAEAVADLLGHDLKATTIVENIGEGNNITEALDNLSGAQSANIAEAIDNYCEVEHTTTTIEEACENLSPSNSNTTPVVTPEPEEPANETPNFSSMTKAELQAWAEEHNIEGVDADSQTKEEMIATIEAALA